MSRRCSLHPLPYNICLCTLNCKNIHCNVLPPFKQHRHPLLAQRISVWRAKGRTTGGRCPSLYLDILVNAGASRPLTSTTGPRKTSLASKSASGPNPCLLSGMWNPTDVVLVLFLEEPTLKYSTMKTGQTISKGSEILHWFSSNTCSQSGSPDQQHWHQQNLLEMQILVPCPDLLNQKLGSGPQ